MIDIILVVVVFFLGVRGYLRGAVLSLLGLAALVVAVIASAPLGPIVGRSLAAQSHLSLGSSYLLGRILAGVAIYIPAIVLAHIVDRRVGRDEEGELRSWNRSLGVLGGLLSGVVIALLLLFVLDVAVKVLPAGEGWLMEASRTSLLRRAVSPHNPADRFLVTDLLKVLRVAQDDPDVLRQLRQTEAFRRLLAHPDVQPLLEDEGLARAVRDQQLERILENENLRRVLADRELRRMIFSPEMRQAIRDVLAEAREGG
jgi:uncharacterized membrane protein required for colicin V production